MFLLEKSQAAFPRLLFPQVSPGSRKGDARWGRQCLHPPELCRAWWLFLIQPSLKFPPVPPSPGSGHHWEPREQRDLVHLPSPGLTTASSCSLVIRAVPRAGAGGSTGFQEDFCTLEGSSSSARGRGNEGSARSPRCQRAPRLRLRLCWPLQWVHFIYFLYGFISSEIPASPAEEGAPAGAISRPGNPGSDHPPPFILLPFCSSGAAALPPLPPVCLVLHPKSIQASQGTWIKSVLCWDMGMGGVGGAPLPDLGHIPASNPGLCSRQESCWINNPG